MNMVVAAHGRIALPAPMPCEHMSATIAAMGTADSAIGGSR
jgi:hypothetical protein